MSLKERMLFELEDMVNYYSADPVARRSICSTGCVYVSQKDTSEGCAIGRKMSPTQQKHVMGSKDTNGDYTETAGPVDEIGKENIPKCMKDFPESFLCDMQYLHDRNQYWTSNGLSKEGQMYLKQLKDSI